MRGLEEDREIAVPTLTAAATGTVLAMLSLLGWPRAVLDWMRVIVPDAGGAGAAPLSLALAICSFAVLGTMLLSIAILTVHRLMRWLGGYRRWILLAGILIAVFAVTFAAEAASQIGRASGNLTASDATGLMIDGGRLTSHGLETIGRRASVTAALAGIVAASFGLVRLLTRRSRTGMRGSGENQERQGRKQGQCSSRR